MEEFTSSLARILSHHVTVNIYSNPHFSVETFLALAVIVVNFLLCVDINNMYEELIQLPKLPIGEIFKDNNLRLESSSKESFCTSVSKVHTGYYNKSLVTSFKKEKTYSRSNCSWVLPHCEGDSFMRTIFADQKPKLDKIDCVLSITPSEYVRRDKQNRLQATQVRECIRSLTKMLESRGDDKVPKDVIKKNLDVMEAHLSNLSVAQDPAKMLMRHTECLDDTLYDLIESLVLSSSLDNPLPFRNIKKQPYNVKDFALSKTKIISSQTTLKSFISERNTRTKSEMQSEEDDFFDIVTPTTSVSTLNQQTISISA